MMCSHSDDLVILCPMCRNKTHMDSISYVKNNQEGEVSSIAIKGSFSTKIESVTMKLMELIAQDPNVKVLVFSTVSVVFNINWVVDAIYYFTLQWEKALTVLGVALELNSINYRILKPGNKYKKTLSDFKVSIYSVKHFDEERCKMQIFQNYYLMNT